MHTGSADSPTAGGAVAFYRDAVLPALQARLDSAFPEFGWQRDRDGWVATNGAFTRSRFGARPGRVVAHGEAPAGFLIHGTGAVSWASYVTGRERPRGRDFLDAVRELARRAGIDPGPPEPARPHDRRAQLLHDAHLIARRELASDRGAAARGYLAVRGLPEAQLEESDLGLIPGQPQLVDQLTRVGYRHDEIEAAGLLADTRWPGRVTGAWRDERGHARTLWARTITNAATDSKYLYLRGSTRAGLPPYGLSRLLAQPPAKRAIVLLVEGLLDVHHLHARGIENVVALGGTSVRSGMFEQLARHGIQRVVLALDSDNPGRDATRRAIDAAARASSAPDLAVIDPVRLAPHKDPDEYLRHHDPGRLLEVADSAGCAVRWRTDDLLTNTNPSSPTPERRAALARTGRWLAALPPRLALEQEDAIRHAARRTGYTPEATIRAFHARYWPRSRSRQQGHDRDLAPQR